MVVTTKDIATPEVIAQGISGPSVEKVVDLVDEQYEGYEDNIDDFVYFDPETQQYYLDKTSLDARITHARFSSSADVSCALNPTEVCVTKKLDKDTKSEVEIAKKDFDAEYERLTTRWTELENKEENDPLTNVMAIIAGPGIFGTAYSVFNFGFQVYSDEPTRANFYRYAALRGHLKDYLLKTKINLIVNEELTDAQQASLAACGFSNLSRLSLPIIKEFGILAFRVLWSLTKLLAKLADAIGVPTIIAGGAYFATRDSASDDFSIGDLPDIGGTSDTGDDDSSTPIQDTNEAAAGGAGGGGRGFVSTPPTT